MTSKLGGSSHRGTQKVKIKGRKVLFLFAQKDLLVSLVIQEDIEAVKRLWSHHLFTIPHHGATAALYVIQITCVDFF
jgi:hypothetical protein